MYLPRKLDNRELMDLLVIHTNRYILIMTHGETYFGEHEVCIRTIELIQEEIISRHSSSYKSAHVNSSFNNSCLADRSA